MKRFNEPKVQKLPANFQTASGTPVKVTGFEIDCDKDGVFDFVFKGTIIMTATGAGISMLAYYITKNGNYLEKSAGAERWRASASDSQNADVEKIFSNLELKEGDKFEVYASVSGGSSGGGNGFYTGENLTGYSSCLELKEVI